MSRQVFPTALRSGRAEGVNTATLVSKHSYTCVCKRSLLLPLPATPTLAYIHSQCPGDTLTPDGTAFTAPSTQTHTHVHTNIKSYAVHREQTQHCTDPPGR